MFAIELAQETKKNNLKVKFIGWKNFVTRAPKLSESVTTREPLFQFKNNFYLLFHQQLKYDDLKKNPENFNLIPEPNSPLAKAQSYGENWENFLKQSRAEIEKLRNPIKILLAYRKLTAYCVQLGRSDLRELFDQLNLLTHSTLGIGAIPYQVWDEINPILKDLAKKMDNCGVPSINFN